jgi:PhnO protein
MEKIKIRKADVGDMLTVYEQICDLEEYTFEINAFQKIFFHNINDVNKLYYLAEDNFGNCLGFISCHCQLLLHHCGMVAEIQELFVKRPFRGIGIGKKLMIHIEQLLKELDCISFEVTAQNKRIKTHEFYKRNAFQSTHLKFTKKIS